MRKGSGKKPYYTIIIALFLALSFLCVWQLIRPRESTFVSMDLEASTDLSVGEQAIMEGVKLPFGSYKVEVFYTAEKDYIADTYLRAPDLSAKELQNNGETVYAKKSNTEFVAWLYRSTEELQLVLNYKGGGNLQIHGVQITESYHMWTMLLTVLAFCGLVATLCVKYHFDWSRKLSRQSKTAILGVVLIALASSFFQMAGGALNSIDLLFHYMRIEGLKDGILSGQFPVRIDPEWLYGQGYACSIFYCNSFLLLPALLRMAGFTVVAACNIFFVVLNFVTAWAAYYCFKKIFDSYKVGLACSALYTLSTYRIYKLYQTGDVGEGLALVFLPVIIYGFFRVFTEDSTAKTYKTAWLPLTIGYAGLMQSHILTCEVALFLTLLTCIVCIRKVIQKKVFLQLCKGAAGAFALSLWYLIPCLDYYLTQDIHIKNLGERTIQNTGLTLSHLFFHFWQKGSKTPLGDNGAQFTYPVGVGLVLLLGLAVFGIFWFNGFSENLKKERELRLGKVAAVFSLLLLVMSLNLFPWDAIQKMSKVFVPLVSSLQFPTRVLGWGTVLLVTVFGVALWYFEKKGWKSVLWIGFVVVLLSAATSTAYMSEHVLKGAGTFNVYHEKGMGAGYVAGGEYLLNGTDQTKLSYEEPVFPEEIRNLKWKKDSLSVEIECKNTSAEESFVDVPLMSYKGYRCEIMDEKATGEESDGSGTTDSGVGARKFLELTHNEKFQVRVIVPAGFEGAFEVRFVPPVYWRISEVVSLIALVLLFVYLIRGICSHRSTAKKCRDTRDTSLCETAIESEHCTNGEKEGEA